MVDIPNHALQQYRQRYCPQASRSTLQRVLDNLIFIPMLTQKIHRNGMVWVVRGYDKIATVLTVYPEKKRRVRH
jgi:hypothetical protein